MDKDVYFFDDSQKLIKIVGEDKLFSVVQEKENNLKSYKEVQQSVSDALVQAQAASQETKAAAAKEAEAIINKANADADRIVNDGIEKARRLSFQTEDMKRQSKVFRSRFRMLVEAQLDLLKNEDWDYLLNYDVDQQKVTEENIDILNKEEENNQEQINNQAVKSEEDKSEE